MTLSPVKKEKIKRGRKGGREERKKKERGREGEKEGGKGRRREVGGRQRGGKTEKKRKSSPCLHFWNAVYKSLLWFYICKFNQPLTDLTKCVTLIIYKLFFLYYPLKNII